MTRLYITETMRKILGKPSPPPRGPSVHVIQQSHANEAAAAEAGWTVGMCWGMPGQAPEVSLRAVEEEDRRAERQALEEQARRKNAAEDAQVEALRRGGRWRTLTEVLADADAQGDRESRAEKARELREYRKWQQRKL